MNEQSEQGAGPGLATRREPKDPTYTPPRMRAHQDAMRQHPELVVHEEKTVDADKRAVGLRDIVGGVFLIGIGFMWGSSVFLGNPTALDWFFDGLGTFWVCKGVYGFFTA